MHWKQLHCSGIFFPLEVSQKYTLSTFRKLGTIEPTLGVAMSWGLSILLCTFIPLISLGLGRTQLFLDCIHYACIFGHWQAFEVKRVCINVCCLFCQFLLPTPSLESTTIRWKFKNVSLPNCLYKRTEDENSLVLANVCLPQFFQKLYSQLSPKLLRSSSWQSLLLTQCKEFAHVMNLMEICK